MRFMLLLKGDPPPGAMPSEELIGAMLRYNQDLARAGVLLAGEGLHSSAAGARVTVSGGGRRTVTDGPFAESKELIAGFLLIDVKSREEAIEWAKRCPVEYAIEGDQEAVVEVRQVAETDELDTMTDEQRAADRNLWESLPGS
jgi:hypothetical protein